MAETIYSLHIRETLATAWHKVKGSKKPFWQALTLIILVKFSFMLLTFVSIPMPLINSLVILIDQFVSLLFAAGLINLGIQRAFDLPMSYDQVFKPFQFNTFIRIIGLMILEMVIIFIPIFLLIIFTLMMSTMFATLESSIAKFFVALPYVVITLIVIYLTFRMILGLAFVLQKNVGPWQAIKMSFQATRENVWRIFLLFILQQIIVIISAVPFGVGLIWAIPFMYILFGTIYKNLHFNLR